MTSKLIENYRYQSGFGNHFSTEAEKGALPHNQNSPQKVPYGLYAEQLSGTSFNALRHENKRSWLYRIRPSVLHSSFSKADRKNWRSRPFTEIDTPPDQLRWNPLPIPDASTDFIDGITTFAGNGDSSSVRGSGAHIYVANKSMRDRFFYNADAEMLIIPESGALELRTEFGIIGISPGEIVVIPRGVKFQIRLPENKARGYICENYGPAFRLPYLGPIGANGLANPRDFLSPVAFYEDVSGEFIVTAKFQGNLWNTRLDHSPLDVVAWHGDYTPYKYDLSSFQVINSVSFDHPDPSIFTVLTSPSELPGTANVDFVIFPPRWTVAEHTFRPAYFHRNCMSEFMGLIFGAYEAKQEGFAPGGASLHNSMSAHGPDANTYEKATTADLKPQYIKDTLAIMFESSLVYNPTSFALGTGLLQADYLSCWSSIKSNFKLQSNRQGSAAK